MGRLGAGMKVLRGLGKGLEEGRQGVATLSKARHARYSALRTN